MNQPSNTSKGGVSELFRKWVAGLNGAGTIWIFALMVLINLDVLLRSLFRAPIDGVPEMVELSIAGIVFLQLSDAVRAGRLTRSDGLFNKLTATRPKLGHIMGLIFDIAGAAFFIAILFGAVPMLIEAWEKNHFAGTEGILTIPVWPIRLILVISCITVVLVFCTFIKRHIDALRNSGVTKS